ncbi:MAG: carboxypeptidase-like regulatory domain-containing protein, partial [Blastocatellia bacterium]
MNIIDNDNGTLLNLAGEVVKASDHTPIANVTMKLQGSQNATTTTDSQGRYSFPNLAPNGNYSVTPSALGYTFNPISQQFNNLTNDNLGVNFFGTPAPSRQLRVIGGDTKPTQNVNVVIELVAQSDENSVGFSLNYDSTILSNPNVVLNADASTAFLTVNNSQNGKVGILLALPSGQAFGVGTKSLVTITFNTTATNAYSSPVTFGDVPLARGVSNTNADDLQANYLDGQVTFQQGYEADTAPRPTGNNNGTITVGDFTQVGRFVAGLNTPDQLNEYQRADCAPRVSLGNGVLSVSDYTQAGRYAAGIDVVNPAGGPAGQSFA